MNVTCSLKGIVNKERPGQGLGDIRKADFDDIYLDLSMYCLEDELEYAGEKTRKIGNGYLVAENPSELQMVTELTLKKAADTGLACAVAAAPYLRRDTKRVDLNSRIRELAEESIKVCGACGCGYLVVRPLFAGALDVDAREVNKEFYLSLVPSAKENDVIILLENQCKSINGHLVRGLCSDGRVAAEWVDNLNREAKEERFGFCIDTGVCNLCGQNMYDFVKILGERVKAVILRDCNGNEENAMLPFTCVNHHRSQTDWLNLIRGLREIGFEGQLIMNLEDTAAAFSPILRPTLLRLAKEVADYFKWQIKIESLLKKYSSIVLFGAGNMCRNYMKCYGEEYPPLFTCDNNVKLWGMSFCGLEVKKPESLKELPEDCAIFICNVYYREIEQQLRDMGIKNPIEFFNDEYMPTFYFDRLEDGGNR